ncbi:GSCOCG00002867001-RA-CDS, partial [Cotesia congregata]
MAKGARILGQVWSIGKRKFGDDWARRIWLFDKLVWSVMCYGVEIWGWKRREEMEKMQERYLRWVLGVSRRVAGYLVREELQRDRLEAKAGMRAWGYEKRLEEGRGRGLEGWESERKEYFEERGWSLVEVEKSWEEGIMRGEDFVKKEKIRQEEERWERIGEAKSNKEYKFIKGIGIPGYLKKGWSEERWSRIARFRLGDYLKGGRYWESREDRLCSVCGMEEETWEHVWEVCSGLGLERG